MSSSRKSDSLEPPRDVAADPQHLTNYAVPDAQPGKAKQSTKARPQPSSEDPYERPVTMTSITIITIIATATIITITITITITYHHHHHHHHHHHPHSHHHNPIVVIINGCTCLPGLPVVASCYIWIWVKLGYPGTKDGSYEHRRISLVLNVGNGDPSGMNRSIFTAWWFGCHVLFSHILGMIIPIDFHIFQRGGPTTNQFINSYYRSFPSIPYD